MKPRQDRSRIEALNADYEAQCKAIWDALPPEERALREERRRHQQLLFEQTELASQQWPHEMILNLSEGALPGGLGFGVEVKIQQAWTAARSTGIAPEQFLWMSPADLRARAAILEQATAGRDNAALMSKKLLRAKGGAPRRPATDGDRIQKLRIETGLTQEQLAEKCGGRFSSDTVYRSERGARLSKNTLQRLAEVFSTELRRAITPEYLLK
jgi:DNA-binding XRE family transcriptional regulator